MEALQLRPLILFSLLPVWVLVGLFQYLSRFTQKRHFKTWTAGWLFYALYLTLCSRPETRFAPAFLEIAKNWCLATAALVMLWGSLEYINVPARQRLIGMMVVFNLIWSCAFMQQKLGATWRYFPSFAFLALVSGFTAFCIFSRRSRRASKGAALLTFAFGLWALFLMCAPFLQAAGTVIYAGLISASVVQLFIAISMMVLVLEETREKLQAAVDSFSKEVHRSSELEIDAETATETHRLLFENSKDAVAIVADEDLEILELNPAARRLFATRESRGVSLQAYCSLPNQKLTEPATFLGALPKSPEVELTLQAGSKVRARTRSQCIRYQGRKARQIIFIEVAERSQLGRHLRGSSGKMSALGQVISGVAHELNNPLAAIKGYTDLMLLTSQIDAQTRNALMKVSLESNRAARLVHDLLAFARPETPNMTPVQVNDAITQFTGQRASVLEAKEITLELDLSPDTEMILASADQFQQVLAHLLNNAVDALEEEEGQRIVRISSRGAENKIQIRFEDNGPGIDPDVLPRIFEPFFTTKPLGTGTGLGLSVCYSIMLQHKGKITCLPSYLGGACFVVEFPAAFGSGNLSGTSIAPNISTPEFRPGSTRAKAARLLVVDDEPSVCALLNDMLTLLGHNVTVHSSPFDALTDLEKQDYDAVLSDFRMPGLNGGELYQRATASEAKYCERFIFLTGDVMDPQTHAFFAAQKVPCILKPFQLSALQSALAAVLDREVSKAVAATA